MSDGLLFGAAWGTLLLAPPLGVLAGFALRRGPAARVRYLYAAAGALLAGAAIVMASPWSLRGVAADAWLLMAAYAAYCAAAAAATLRLRPSRLRVLLGAVLAVPVALGLVLGTIGVLGLAFVSTTVAFIFYYRLIADVGPVKASTVTLLVPIFCMV